MWKPLAIGLLLVVSIAAQAENNNELDQNAEYGTVDETASLEEDPALAKQKDELFGLLAQVDERYGDVSASLKNLEAQIVKSNATIDKLRNEMSSNQEQLDKLNDELSGQVRAAYATGQQDKLKLMLNQQDPALYSRMMVYYEYMNRSRLEKLSNLQRTIKYLDQLDLQKKTETDELEKKLAQRKGEQTALSEARKQRDKLILRLNDEFSSPEDQINLLKESELKLVGLLGRLEHENDATAKEDNSDSLSEDDTGQVGFPKLTGDFPSLKGKLPLPVTGKLSNMFDGSTAGDMWKGIVINAREGADIRAVSKGHVVFADNMDGYGLLIIIEHDKDFMTLYAFNQSLLKHKGDWVEAGDVIASVGQSGGRVKPGLYFEIRQRGKPVDPLLWCRN